MSTPAPKPAAKRFQQIVKLRPEHYEAYKTCHAKVWPEVLEQIRQCHIEDYSISYDEASHILFASFKWTGHDFEADMKAMRENDKVREWWRMTDGYQQSVAEGAVSSEKGGVDGVPGWWKPLEEVFYFAG